MKRWIYLVCVLLMGLSTVALAQATPAATVPATPAVTTPAAPVATPVATPMAAPAATADVMPVAPVATIPAAREEHIDIDVSDENFATDLHEIWHDFDENQQITVRLSGYVYRYPTGEDVDVQFAVLRDYASAEEGVTPYGMDCYYEGDLPENDDWVRVTGQPVRYEDESGEVYLMLMVQTLERVPEAERGPKQVLN